MYCTNCGKEVQSGSLYCGNCGKPISLGSVALPGNQGMWVRPYETLIVKFNNVPFKQVPDYFRGTSTKEKAPTLLVTDKRIIFLNKNDQLLIGHNFWVFDLSLSKILDQEMDSQLKQYSAKRTDWQKEVDKGTIGSRIINRMGAPLASPSFNMQEGMRTEVRWIGIEKELFGGHYLNFTLESFLPTPYLEWTKNLGSENKNPGMFGRLMGGSLAYLQGNAFQRSENGKLFLPEEMVNQIYETISSKLGST